MTDTSITNRIQVRSLGCGYILVLVDGKIEKEYLWPYQMPSALERAQQWARALEEENARKL